MKYMMLVCVAEGTELSAAEAARIGPDTEAWVAEMDRRGIRLQGDQLRPVSDATTVRCVAARCWSRTARSPRPRSRSPASTSSSAPTWTRPSRSASKHPVARFGERRGAAVLGGVNAGRRRARSPRRSAQEWGRVVAALIGMTGDWDLAEECAQDAFAQALRPWPRDGVPRRPGAWLTTVARNRALDRLRRGSDRGGQAAGGGALSGPGRAPDLTTTAASPTTGCG